MTESDLMLAQPITDARYTFLLEEGYRPQFSTPGSISFHYREGLYLLTVEEEDPLYLRVAAPNFWSIDDPQERQDALEVAAEIQWRYKAVKVTLTGNDNTWATAEVFLPEEEAFSAVFDRTLQAVYLGVRQFSARMRERRTSSTGGMALDEGSQA